MTKKKDPKDIKKAGRKTKWTPKLNDKIIEYFSLEPSYEREVMHTNKKGETWSSYEDKPNRLPTLFRFAMLNHISQDAMEDWAKEENKDKYPGFIGSYKAAKQLQKEFLIDNALSGLYNPTFSIFTAKNITDMRDQMPMLTPDGANVIGGFILVKPPETKEDAKKDIPGSTPNN